MDLKTIGQKIKQQFPTGIASDGRAYSAHTDEELGQKYLQKYGNQLQSIQEGQQKPTDFGEKAQAALSIGLSTDQYQPQKAFKPAELDKLNNTRDTLDRVNRVIGAIQNNQDFPEGPQGKISEFMINHGLGGLSGLSPETQQAIGDINVLRGQGDRQIIGGRLTGYLLDKLGIGFPGVEKLKSVNLKHLEQLRTSLHQSLDSYAQNGNYKSINALPGFEDYQSSSNKRPPLSSFNQ